MSEVALSNFTASPHRATARPGLLRSVKRWALISLGVVLFLVGTVGAVLPGHLGLPIMVVGLAVVLRNSIWAKRKFVTLQRRHPNWVFPLRRLMRPKPEFAPVFWQSFLRTERFILAKELRQLKRLRRWLRRRAKR